MPLPAENLGHKAFPQPTDQNVLVWRYIDLAKLIHWLATDQLVLSRIDTLRDPYEGRHGRRFQAFVEDFTLVMLGDRSEQRQRMAREHARLRTQGEGAWRGSTFVSCWCADGPRESEAMWRIHASANASVALVLPYARLRESLNDPQMYIGEVGYFDYEMGVVDSGNAFNAVMHKREEFSYEHEVRIVKMDAAAFEWIMPAADGPLAIDPDSVGVPRTISTTWRVSEHIERVVVSPYASAWQRDAIVSVVRAMAPALEGRIRDSVMRNQ